MILPGSTRFTGNGSKAMQVIPKTNGVTGWLGRPFRKESSIRLPKHEGIGLLVPGDYGNLGQDRIMEGCRRRYLRNESA